VGDDVVQLGGDTRALVAHRERRVAGVSAIVALIVLGGPLSFYGNEYLKSHGHVTGHSADTPHAHT
jgi:hypothetical protein